jgi:hypothetical protein
MLWSDNEAGGTNCFSGNLRGASLPPHWLIYQPRRESLQASGISNMARSVEIGSGCVSNGLLGACGYMSRLAFANSPFDMPTNLSHYFPLKL